MKFFKLALVALALVSAVAIVGCSKTPAGDEKPAEGAAPTAPAPEAPAK